jgi:hypothetical protein
VSLGGVVEIRARLVREIPSPRYSAQWQPDDRRRETFRDAEFEELDAALGWGRARAPAVFVDVTEEPFVRVRYQIGDHVWELPRWPHPLPAAPPRVDGHGGTAYLRDEARWDEAGYLAVHRDDDVELELAHHEDVEAAIDWGRERAAVVVVELLPETFGWPPPPKATRYSAGVEDPAGERLLRLRPRPGRETMRWRGGYEDGESYVVEAATRREARDAILARYVRETLKPEDGIAFVLGSAQIEPLEGE